MKDALTIAQVRARVEHIRAVITDDEAAHGCEDELRADFIKHVAQFGPPDLAEMAREILRTDAMDFARWCA